MRSVKIKRAYDAPARGDGFRVLVDRVWPRGVSKDQLRIDAWAKEVAPTTALRKWFGHDPARWPEFQRRYERELRAAPAHAALKELVTASKGRTTTLVYGAKDTEHNQAVVLKHVLQTLL